MQLRVAVVTFSALQIRVQCNCYQEGLCSCGGAIPRVKTIIVLACSRSGVFPHYGLICCASVSGLQLHGSEYFKRISSQISDCIDELEKVLFDQCDETKERRYIQSHQRIYLTERLQLV